MLRDGLLISFYFAHLALAALWFFLGVLAGWALRPAWWPLPSPFDAPMEFLILSIPHALALGLFGSLALRFFSRTAGYYAAAGPILYAVVAFLCFFVPVFRHPQPTDHLQTYFSDPAHYNLVQAIFQRDEGRTRQLLSEGLSLELYEKSGMTPLMFAASRCDWKTVEFLIRLGADPNTSVIPPDSGYGPWPKTALSELWDQPTVTARPARGETRSECLGKTSEILLSAGAKKSIQVRNSNLLDAVITETPSKDLLLPYLSEATAEQLNLSAYMAAFMRRYDILDLLLSRGASPDFIHPKWRKSVRTILTKEADQGSAGAKEALRRISGPRGSE